MEGRSRWSRTAFDEADSAVEATAVHAELEARASSSRRFSATEKRALLDEFESSDEPNLGRDVHGAVHVVVVRETLVPKTLWVSVGPPLTGAELVRGLEATAQARGSWPLVAGFDNGGANRPSIVRECLEAQGVIVLFNLPRTPQRNAHVEHAIGEEQCACSLDTTTDLPVDELPRSSDDLEAQLKRAARALEHTPRWSVGGKTPAEIDAAAKRAEDHVRRDQFYAEVHAALACVAEQPLNARARRRVERDAIL